MSWPETLQVAGRGHHRRRSGTGRAAGVAPARGEDEDWRDFGGRGKGERNGSDARLDEGAHANGRDASIPDGRWHILLPGGCFLSLGGMP